MIANDTFLRALRREPTPYTPVWLMRQAGRYLPEYNATRAKAGSFMALAHNPDLATEVTLQPLARFPLDAAILFSDILTVPDAMGLGLSFAEGEGPRFARPCATRPRSRARRAGHGQRSTTCSTRSRRSSASSRGRVPLIGFAGSPFTLACYMIEGSGSADFATVRRMAYSAPRPARAPRRRQRARGRRAYLDEQIAHGADAVMLFDTWGGLLTADAYRRFSLAPMRAIIEGLARVAVPADRVHQGRRRVAARDRRDAAPRASASTGPSTSRRRARESASRVALQGNLDPLVLLTDPATVAREAARDRARRRSRAGPRLQSRPRHRARRRRPTTSPRSSRPYTPPRAKPAPLLELRRTPESLWGNRPETRASAGVAGP